MRYRVSLTKKKTASFVSKLTRVPQRLWHIFAWLNLVVQ
jgi:hypothetical protein